MSDPTAAELARAGRSAESLARAGDPPTSHAAARSLDPDTLTGLRAQVYDAFRASPFMGWTDEELVDELVYRRRVAGSPSGIRTRRRELTDAGLLRFADTYRQTRSGRSAAVWELV